ncbi:DUF1648 domain-containing protein [Bacillus sp. FJAT-49736]|uniref:DUF1648 domain-containing protein n=1 Tax=Bacillus sp. FJAT-49736 TaxID=2833582 RepID=UPI0020169CE2|nr:DUF1648 domain-containing protein [Bacillus sp. FJAT-49736]
MKRPKLNIPRSKIEIILDIFCLLLIIGNIVYLMFEYPSLSSRIPIHFNGDVPDGWGNKGMLWVLPAVSIVIALGLTILERFPHTFNYSHLSEVNIEKQYKNARQMMNVFKAESTLLFVYYSWQWIQLTMKNNVGLGIWEIPIILVIIIGTIVFFIVRSARIK